jgi:hypothetical protein
MSMNRLALVLLALVPGFSACTTPSASNASSEGGSPPTAQAGGAAATAVANGEAGARTITGSVVETMDAASYTYVRVDTGTEQVWAAASQFPVKIGDRVSVSLEFPLENFHSKALNRDFPVIYFVSQIGREGEAAASSSSPTQLPPGHAPIASHGTKTVAAPVAGEFAPAAGSLSVADVWTRRASLAGSKVTVRGKVMKVNNGIMGRNWIHLQDGTGVGADGTNDLTLTSDATVKVGDVVTATGTVAVDKDFTAGYKYAVLIEGATFSTK